jgi:transcription termination/antitermination protein NusG
MSFTPDNESESTPTKVAVGKPRWYVVQVAAGCEKKVKTDIEQRVNSFNLSDRVLDIRIPQSPTVRVRKDGSRYQGEEKVLPGYVLVQMILDDHAWQMVKNTSNVINFVGAEQRRAVGRGRGHVKPMPLSHSEVDRIFKQMEDAEPVVKIDMQVGDKILVLSGPFKDFAGEVIEVSTERSKLKALLSIFGRDTPVELEFNQVEKQG